MNIWDKKLVSGSCDCNIHKIVYLIFCPFFRFEWIQPKQKYAWIIQSFYTVNARYGYAVCGDVIGCFRSVIFRCPIRMQRTRNQLGDIFRVNFRTRLFTNEILPYRRRIASIMSGPIRRMNDLGLASLIWLNAQSFTSKIMRPTRWEYNIKSGSLPFISGLYQTKYWESGLATDSRNL